MRIVFVGADLEENLGIGILAAVCEREGHEAVVVPFNDPAEGDQVVARALAARPDVVGLSIQFQHRAQEFLRLARQLRAAGFAGHLTCGGQFPSLAHDEVLSRGHGIDSVVLHDGEETLVELLSALADGTPLADVAGLAHLEASGAVARTAPRRLPQDLDAIPFAKRYRPHLRHLGVPFIPIVGGRGCWGKCAYCSIVSFYGDARRGAGGATFRLRSPENIAEEIALLAHRAGEPAIFCFHDDNFTLPRPDKTIARMRAIRSALDGYGVGRVAFVGKARPDTVTPELARELAELGVIRLYVGVENGSTSGSAHLRRGTQQESIRGALRACREAGIFVCYNLLVFEPWTRLADVAENVAFIREHQDHPVNFCRAEPYYGTPLHLDLSGEQDLGGSYLGWNYRMEDDRAELLFRIASAAFRERNFDARGVANRYMGLGYAANVLRFFRPGHADAARLGARAAALTRTISLDSAAFLERAMEIAATVDLGDRDAIERKTARLGLEVSAADTCHHVALDELYDELHRVAAEPLPRVSWVPTRKFRRMARNVLLGASLAALSAGCREPLVVDPVPPDQGDTGGDPPGDDDGDYFVVDPVPADLDVFEDAPGDAGDAGDAGDGPRDDQDLWIVDPAPRDADVFDLDDPVTTTEPEMYGFIDDPAPWDLDADEAFGAGDADADERDVMVVDPPPPDLDAGGEDDELYGFYDPAPWDLDGGVSDDPDLDERDVMVVDPPPPDLGTDGDSDGDDSGDDMGPESRLMDQWHDSSPKRTVRTHDLPLFGPPRVRLAGEARGQGYRITIVGLRESAGVSWETRGSVEGDGVSVLWTPADAADGIRAAVRTRGGVAVVSWRS